MHSLQRRTAPIFLALAFAAVLLAPAPSRAAPPPSTADPGLARDLSSLARRLWAQGSAPDVASQAIAAARLWRSGQTGSALVELRHCAASLRDVLARDGDLGWRRARAAQADVLALGARAALATSRLTDLVYFLEAARGSALFTRLVADAQGWTSTPASDLERLEALARGAEAAAYARWRTAHADGELAQVRVARQELDRARRRVAEARRHLERTCWEAGGEPLPPPATTRELERALEPGEALVQYALLATDARALVVRRDGIRLVSLCASADLLARAAALDVGASAADVQRAADDVRAALVEPLGLTPEDRRVFVVPDGRLAHLPYGWLLGDRAVALAPSGSVWLRLREEAVRRGVDVLAVGDPDYGTSPSGVPLPVEVSGRPLPPLAAAAAEVRRVGDSVYVGGRATETALREALASVHPWAAVHVACHGLLADVPDGCALALAPTRQDDGLLTVPEIEDLVVRTDLVLLSACHTGEGPVIDPEGCVGLARAFLVAGAPCVLASLGSVDDAATAALMDRFHAWWRQGVAPAEALRRAQAHVRAQPAWTHPRFWACWTLWGFAD